MKKLIGSIGVVLALGAGAFALSTVLPAGAQTSPGGTSTDDPAGPAGRQKPGERVKGVLDGLVANGTISQDQEDKIIAALQAAKPAGGPGLRGPGIKGLIGKGVDTAAGALGITADELKADLKGGKSIADVAAEKKVPLDTVTKALTDAATKAVDDAVASGKLSKDQADKIKANLSATIERLENAKGPFGRRHR
jgi:polyhydroxyalkanoate synthesis regulator phasin